MNLLWFLPLFSFFYMSAWFFVSLRAKRYDVIDVAWGPGFIFLTLLSLYSRNGDLDFRTWLLLILIFFWGLRLFIHTFRRNLKREEDWRYHEWHDSKSCRHSICTYVQVFLFQAALMMIISLPVVYSINLIFLPMVEINYVGLVLALIGLSIETIADQQRFLFLSQKDNKNKIMTKGLWRFSRHPNYFGEITFWWGIYFLVLGAPQSWMLLISPLMLTYIMVFVSGLPTEKKYKDRQDFKEYKMKTSPLIPWFTKKNK